ncbi:MAG TPA: TolC family protein [Planctomycetota bacterium]|nr:TolC family protein [Planctomycetota bacterium]
MSIVLVALTSLPLAAEEAAPRTLTLEESIRLSASVAQVELSRLDSAIARASYGAERAGLRPQLDLVAGWLRQRQYQQVGDQGLTTSPANTVDARLRVGQALIDLETWNRTQAANRRLAAAEAATTLSLEDAAVEAGNSYADLATAEALVGVRREDLTLAQELLDLSRKQVEAGATEGIAVTRAENRVAAAKTALTAADGQLRTGSITLSRSLRLDPATVLVPGNKLAAEMATSSAPQAANDAVTSAQQNRPELHVSSETLAAVQADYRAARGARLPRLDAFADAGRIGPELDDTDTSWRVGVELRIPLIDRSRYDQEAAMYRVEQQRVLRDDLLQRISAEVRNAVVRMETGAAGLVSAQEERRLGEQELSEARARFAAGVAGNLELVEAQRSLSVARERVVTAQSILVRARIGLARAVGLATTLK